MQSRTPKTLEGFPQPQNPAAPLSSYNPSSSSMTRTIRVISKKRMANIASMDPAKGEAKQY